MKSGPKELARFRAEEIDPRTNAPWKKGMKPKGTGMRAVDYVSALITLPE